MPETYAAGQFVFVDYKSWAGRGPRRPPTRFRVLFLDSIRSAWWREPKWRLDFAVAETALGVETKVLWVIKPDRPLFTLTTFNGFPILIYPDGKTVGLDGVEVKVEIEQASAR